MNIKHNSFHTDVVGSMLRPVYLLNAQERLKQGDIPQSRLTHLEDKAVRQAVEIQERTGLDVITDGEMRRPVFCHNFVKAVEGFAWNIPGNTVIWFDMEGKKIIDPVTVGVVGKLKKVRDISVDEFAFLRGITDTPTKVTIPSPTMMTYYFVPGISDAVYTNPNTFLDEVTEILRDAVSELEKIGAHYIQVDAPEFGMLIDPVQQEWFAAKGFDPEELIENGIHRINRVFEGFSGLKGLHICRGNDKNRFMARGGYERIAKQIFRHARVDRLLLEFDSDRAGGFEPLVHVRDSVTVVLGLITTKSPILEKHEDVVRKIREAQKFIPKERMALSTQCGFASVARGNNLSFENQEQKLRLVIRVAKSLWH